MMKKGLVAITLLTLLSFLIPFDRCYDQWLRFFSKTLIPAGLVFNAPYDKKIYFFISDLIILFLSFFTFKKEMVKNPIWIVFLMAFVSIVVSPFSHYGVTYTRLLHLLTPMLLFSILSGRENATKPILTALVCAGLLQAGIAIGQYFNQAPLGLTFLRENKDIVGTIMVPDGTRWIFDSPTSVTWKMRACGTLSHPNILGGFLLTTVFASYALLATVKKHRPLLPLIPLLFFAMTLTFSRSALYAWLLGSTLWLGLMIYKKHPRVKTIAITLLVSTALTFTLLHKQISSRGGITNYNELAKGSDQGRVELHKVAFQIIEKNPFFGLGYNQFSQHSAPYFSNSSAFKESAPHNIYLFLACETGLFSLLAFLGFLALLAKRAIQSSITPEFATFASLFLAFLFIGGCDHYFILCHQSRMCFFLIAGLLACNSFPLQREQKAWHTLRP